MNTNVLTVTEAVRNFSEYVSRVAYRHETFVLRKGKKSVAELRDRGSRAPCRETRRNRCTLRTPRHSSSRSVGTP